jgi:hypothetical protein
MANGRPGDHPLTDVLRHGRAVFGPEVDGLIREVAALGGQGHLAAAFSFGDFEWTGDDDAQVARLRAHLLRLRDELAARGDG